MFEVDGFVSVINTEAANKVKRHGDLTPIMRVFDVNGDQVFITRNLSAFGKDGAKQIMSAMEGESILPDGTRLIRSPKLIEFGFCEDYELKIVPVDVNHLEPA